MTDVWMNPPAKPLLRVYFFNTTNPAGFLKGEKPFLVEVLLDDFIPVILHVSIKRPCIYLYYKCLLQLAKCTQKLKVKY